MISRRVRIAVLVGLIASITAILGIRFRQPGSNKPLPLIAKIAAPVAAPASPVNPFASLLGARAKTGRQSRYRLESTHATALDGTKMSGADVAGRWTTTERADGLTEVVLTASRLDLTGQKAPALSELAAPFLLEAQDGRLTRIGFSPQMPETVRQLVTGLATRLQVTKRDQQSWMVQEEDLTGRYEANYTREGNRVRRTRSRYLSLRDSHEKGKRSAAEVTTDEQSEFVFDDQGLLTADVRLHQTIDLGKGLPIVTLDSSSSLARESTAEVALAAARNFKLEPISLHLDRTAINRNRLQGLVNGASAEQLIQAAKDSLLVNMKLPHAESARWKAMQRMEALAELDPKASAKFADAARDNADNKNFLGIVLGALASANSPDASQALAALLPDMPPEPRRMVITELALCNAPTAATAAALTQEISQPADGYVAAMALGSQAAQLGDADGAGADAVQLLLQLYASATTPQARQNYLGALGNTGSRLALQAMEDAITSNDYTLARVGAFGLRFIPGDDVDDALDALIANGTSVILEAIQATGYRSGELWLPRMQGFQAQFQGQKRVLDAIQSVIGQWQS